MTITMTVPDRIGEAMKKKGTEYDLDAPGWLKSMLFAAAHSPTGVLLKLDLAPVAPDPAQLALPLGGAEPRTGRLGVGETWRKGVLKRPPNSRLQLN